MPDDTHAPPSGLLDHAYGSSRRSTQREAIAQAAETFGGAFSVEDLQARVRAVRPGVGAATVYRAVAAMLERGYLESVGEHEGRALYLRCLTDEHHHHLVCTGCGNVTHTPCPLDNGAVAHAAQQGFVITRHEVSVYGLCAACLHKDDGR